jgi:hypothetical protein
MSAQMEQKIIKRNKTRNYSESFVTMFVKKKTAMDVRVFEHGWTNFFTWEPVGLFQSDLEPEDLTIKILHFKNC